MGHLQQFGIIKLRHYQLRFLFCFCLIHISALSYGQGLSEWYNAELEKRLYPKVSSDNEKQVLMFVAKPSFVKPEYSLRIVEKANQSFLELRIIEKNLWNELFRLRTMGASEITLSNQFYSIVISEFFKNKMLDAFSNAISANENRVKPSGPRTFDGTCYEFYTFECGKEYTIKIDYNLEKNDIENVIAIANDQIANDIRNGLFAESKYDIYK
jgi:hypothetical protein